LLVAISFLLCFIRQTETSGSEKLFELADARSQNSRRRSSSGEYYRCAFDACWAHMSLLQTLLFAFPYSSSPVRAAGKIEIVNLQLHVVPFAGIVFVSFRFLTDVTWCLTAMRYI
jgi:hypothetical protein